MNRLERIKGCMLGGAVGDALGAPVEFLEWPVIEAKYGRHGITDFTPAYGQIGAITDDTQMMLFTAEGLLRAYVRGSSRGICHVPGVIHHALLRWLVTQNEQPTIHVSIDGWLINEKALWARRSPGTTCISALRSSQHLGSPAQNYSKGCGALVRSAPCAFFAKAFDNAAEAGRLTHGHPSGYLAAGLFADILQRMVDHGASLEKAVIDSLATHGHKPGMEEVRELLERVMFFVREGYRPIPERIGELGGGWVAEEALAIGVWCALMADNLEQGIIRAVNHSGDSDSTGLVAGHLLGVEYGAAAIPARWFQRLELRGVIGQVAEDIEAVPRDYCGVGGEEDGWIEVAYPGG